MSRVSPGQFVLGLIAIFLIGADRDEIPATSAIRFRSVDIFVNPHGQPLAAYQIEFTGESNQVKLVGIEGGEHKAFKEPPYYDPKALNGNRVILAALNAGDDLPREKTRVARLHLQIAGPQHPELWAKLIVAASSNDKTIQAEASVSEGVIP